MAWAGRLDAIRLDMSRAPRLLPGLGILGILMAGVPVAGEEAEAATPPAMQSEDAIVGDSEGYEPQDINTLTAAIQRPKMFTQMGNVAFFYWKSGHGRYIEGNYPPEPANVYAVTVSAFPLYSEDQEAYYFLMTMSGNLALSNQYNVYEEYWGQLDVSNYAVSIEVSATAGSKPDNANIRLLSDPPEVPQTTVGSETLSDSYGMSYSLGGTVGYSSDGASGQVNGGISWNWSTTSAVTTADVTVENTSGTNQGGNDVTWTYEFNNRPKAVKGPQSRCQDTISSPPASARTTFVPQTAWIWEVQPEEALEAPEFVVNASLTVKLGQAYVISGNCNIFGCDCRADYLDPEVFGRVLRESFSVSFPFAQLGE